MQIIVPDPYRITLERLPSGGVVLRQTESQENLVLIPPQYVREVAIAIAACVVQNTSPN